MFKGSIVAIITPFKKGKVDEEGFRRLIEFQIENGTSAIVPVGTTGESATLDMEEHKRTLEIAVEAVKKRVPVIAGTGGNSTAEAIELTEHAREDRGGRNPSGDALLQQTDSGRAVPALQGHCESGSSAPGALQYPGKDRCQHAAPNRGAPCGDGGDRGHQRSLRQPGSDGGSGAARWRQDHASLR